MPTFVYNERYPYALTTTTYDFFGVGHLVTTGSELSPWVQTTRTTRTSNPNYRIQLAKHVDASTPYFRSGLKDVVFRPAVFLGDNISIGVRDSYSRIRWSGGVLLPVEVEDTALRDLALTRLKRKLYRNIGSMDTLVPILEIRDLRETIKGSAELTTSLVKSLIDIKRTRGKSAFKYASKAWLTYGFGIRPMIEDTKNLCNAIATYLERQDRTVRLTGTASKTWMERQSNGATYNVLAPAVSTEQIFHTMSYRYTAGFNLPLKSGNNYRAIEHLGLDLPSLVPALWEAMAFSWVLDYFGNVGEFLSDVFTSPPGNVLYCVLNRRYTAEIEVTISASITDPKKTRVFINRNGFARGKYFEFSRASFGSVLPHVSLRVRSADEIGNYAVSKLLNLTSILGASTPAMRRGSRQSGGGTSLYKLG